MKNFGTIEDAAREWVSQFNAIPQTVLEKLMNAGEEISEITPPAVGDRVFIYGDEWYGECGEIVQSKYDSESDLYAVHLDTDKDRNSFVVVSSNDFNVEHDEFFPMWGTMWQFSDDIDKEYFTGEYGESHLQEMADCGFRIYEQEDYGLIFGIDGCGYDFFGTNDEPGHWINLYKVRGLRWHSDS